MNSLFLLVPLGVLFVAAAGLLLIWAFRNGQFEDLDEIAGRMLNDEADAGPAKAAQGVRKDDSGSR